ncbi:MAG: prolipoprotein diacylglyceryl transferase family protein [Pseudomonadota bacterium]
MSNLLFVSGLALVLALVLPLAFKSLPRERWQVLACLPVAKEPDGRWRAVNLTFYGLFNANAILAAVALFLALMAAAGLTPLEALTFLAPLLALCLPAARLVAWLVERKPHTLTIGGSSFVGLMLAPPLAWLVGLPLVPVLAAMGVSYALGEGLGRLACISFGCCYGRPLEQCGPLLQRLFRRHAFIFHGPSKKIAYASGLEGQPVLPLQALSILILSATALAGAYLFLEGHFTASLLLSITTSQLWRAGSEVLRADYRGEGRVSAYQIMALLAAAFYLALAWFLPATPMSAPRLAQGLAALWHPGLLLCLLGLWSAILLYTGLSRVTTASVSVAVLQNRI